MDWKRVSNDEIDVALDQFTGLVSAGWAQVCRLIHHVDARQSWMADGAGSLTDWVAARLNVRHKTAVQLVAVSRRLTELPVLSRRFASGELTLDQVDAMSRMVTADTEADLIDWLSGLSNSTLDRQSRRHQKRSADDDESAYRRRSLIRQWNLDESELRFRGRLPGAEGRIFDQAVDTRVDAMGPNTDTGMFDSLDVRSADALVEMAATAAPERGSSTQLTVFAELDALTSRNSGWAELDNTATISNETAQRLSCDSIVETVVTQGGQPIGIGLRSRKIPGWLRRLVYHRDGNQCQHPGCTNTRWLQVHHIVAWSQGGPTDLDNLILLCGFHHRLVHEHGWHITGPPSNRVFRRPDWTPHPKPRQPLHPRLATLTSM